MPLPEHEQVLRRALRWQFQCCDKRQLENKLSNRPNYLAEFRAGVIKSWHEQGLLDQRYDEQIDLFMKIFAEELERRRHSEHVFDA